jgi:ubiquinone/menaquinone biosynthesis C-methylase UbiE
MKKTNLRKFAQDANIALHTQLAEAYDDQPHFKPENQERVKALLKEYAKKTGGKRLLDLGCGTGFIMELAQPYFDEIMGVDITPKMLEIAENKFKKKGYTNLHLQLESTDKLPFDDNSFDMVTAYSFMHHLTTPIPTFKEAYRVLKKGGIFYADLDPNFYFWEAIKKSADAKNVSDLLKVDIEAICDMTSGYKEMKKIEADAVRGAEYIEATKGGYKEEEIVKALEKVGFSRSEIDFHWFWQESKVIKDLSPKEALYFENHLKLGLPITRPWFKYFKTEAVK